MTTVILILQVFSTLKHLYTETFVCGWALYITPGVFYSNQFYYFCKFVLCNI